MGSLSLRQAILYRHAFFALMVMQGSGKRINAALSHFRALLPLNRADSHSLIVKTNEAREGGLNCVFL